MDPFNASEYLVDRQLGAGNAERIALRERGRPLTYAELLELVCGAAAGPYSLGGAR